MASTRRTAKAVTCPVSAPDQPEPLDAPMRTSRRQRTLTMKQQLSVDARAQKESAAHARQEMQVLRAYQEKQKQHDYQYESALNDPPESEEEDAGVDSVFSVTTMPAPKRVVVARQSTHLSQDFNVPMETPRLGPPHPRIVTRESENTPPLRLVTRESENSQRVNTPRTPHIDVPARRIHNRADTPRPGTISLGTSTPPYTFQGDDVNVRIMYPDMESDGIQEIDAPDADTPALGIRKNPPSEIPSESTAVVKQPRYETVGSRNRVRARDFDNLTQKVLDAAIIEYRVIICTKDPFPDLERNRDICAEVWRNACASRNVRIELSHGVMGVLTNRASTVRGRLKTVARPVVRKEYDLDKANNNKVNRTTAAKLLDKNTYVYRNVETREGCLLAPAISSIINLMWFDNKEDDGITFSGQFGAPDDGIPIETIALVLTVIENCIDEYQGGQFQDTAFSGAIYRSTYVARVAFLEDLAEKTEEHAIVPRIRRRLLKIARKHAKANDNHITQNSLLEDAEVEAVKKDWEGILFSDEE